MRQSLLNLKNARLAVLAAALSVMALPAKAGVLVGGTRVVYDGTKREASISVKNTSQTPYVVQVWLDGGSENARAKPPFALTPPIFRLDPNKENNIRIMYSGQGLPEDRESVYWLNVQEIPPKSEQENVLQIAVRTRIKLFYRPPALAKESAARAGRALQWKIVREGGQHKPVLIAENPTPFSVNLSEAKLVDAGKEIPVKAEMIPAKSSQRLEIQPPLPFRAGQRYTLSYRYINDYGGVSDPEQAEVE